MSIQRAEEERVTEYGQASIYVTAAERQMFGQVPIISPNQSSGLDTKRLNTIGWHGDKHVIINDQRARFDRIIRVAILAHPQQPQAGDIRRCDLIDRAEAMTIVGARIG